MTGHRAVIATGPGTLRRLCCDTTGVTDETAEMSQAALDAIDDRVALVDGRPVAVESLWCSVLRSMACGDPLAQNAIQVVHPSWWPTSRIDVVTAAASALFDDVQVRPRSGLLRQASNAGLQATVVVEIAERLVAIAGEVVVGAARGKEPQSVAEETSRHVNEMTCGTTTTVLINAPGAVGGAKILATLIAAGVRRSGRTVMEIDDDRLSRLVASSNPAAHDDVLLPQRGAVARRARSRVAMLGAAAAVVLAATAPAIATGGQRGVRPVPAARTTFLVEGRVALMVPANWPTQRVVAGPGSARVQVTSPSDAEVALHITQSTIPGETLSATGERLKHAIDIEPAGVFVDFNPSGLTAGRPAVTYREVRASHHVRWTVLVEGSVRISIGCQSRPGGEDAVRDACDEAVRSAHAIG